MLRILYIRQLEDAAVHGEIALSVSEVVRAVESFGHRVQSGAFPFGLEKLARIFAVVPQAGVAWLLEREGKNAQELTPPSASWPRAARR